jgi:hypothetical protein
MKNRESPVGKPGVGRGNYRTGRGPICFKIKRPDYGSGQLERDLIFLRLKDLFDG